MIEERVGRSPALGRPSTAEARGAAVERAVEVMRRRYAEPWPVSDLAEVARVSPFHLHRIFGEVTGVPPARFLAALRMEAAKRLLLTTDLRVTDVCYEIGYCSLGTFTSQFTALVGLQPRRFRRLARAHADRPLREVWPTAAPSLPERGSAFDLVVDDAFTGVGCAGLFDSGMPQGVPARCVLTCVPGRCAIDVPAGGWHLLVMAIPALKRVGDVLLPDQEQVRVGSCVVPHASTVRLRRTLTTDPPVVLAFPLLLLDAVETTEQPARSLSGA
jgi:AraC-like DNA-binding protein